jgi:hypothetical protein
MPLYVQPTIVSAVTSFASRLALGRMSRISGLFDAKWQPQAAQRRRQWRHARVEVSFPDAESRARYLGRSQSSRSGIATEQPER